MKKSLAALLLIILVMYVRGQEDKETNSWNLQVNLGASIVNSNGTTGPMVGFVLLNPTNKYSFVNKSQSSFLMKNYERDYRLLFMEYTYQNYCRSKYNTERPYRSILAGSFGISWSRYGNKKNNSLTSGKNLVSDSLLFPANWLHYEIRYNLLPQKLTRNFVQDYSNLSGSFYYQFGFYKRY